MKTKNKTQNLLSLVLSGGGARGAYEAGVIHYLRTQLPKPARNRNFPIQVGSSVGALNTCFMAATAENPDFQGEQIRKIWEELKTGDIFLGDLASLSKLLAKTTAGVAYNLIRGGFFKDEPEEALHFTSLFDTKPFYPYLKRIIPWKALHRNVRSGLLRDVALVATRMKTGRSEIFLQKRAGHLKDGKFIVHPVDLGPEHAMASAAIPIVFPNIAIGKNRYVDGSLRLNTPLAPAIRLGAQKILTVSPYSYEKESPKNGAKVEHPSSLGEQLGKLFNAIFLDRMSSDIEQMERINGILKAGEKVFGSHFLERINKALASKGSLLPIELLEISPSLPLSKVFSEWYGHSPHASSGLSVLEKFYMRALDIEPASSVELLSYMVFEKEYLGRLMDLGFEDGKRNRHKLISFLT